MSETARAVLRVLRDHCGAQNAIRARQVALLVGISGASRAKRVSDAVAELRREHGHLICGGSSGYYLAVTDAEQRAYIESIDARIAGLARTRRAIASKHPEYAQMTLEV